VLCHSRLQAEVPQGTPEPATGVKDPQGRGGLVVQGPGVTKWRTAGNMYALVNQSDIFNNKHAL